MRRANEPTGRRRHVAFFSDCFAGNVRLATTAVRSLDETDEDDTSTGHKVLPKNPEMFAYDADGNLVSDARFEYAWDAENRLVAAIDRTAPTETAPTGGVRFVVSNAYDHASRRIAKTVFRPDADGTLLPETCSTFHYDGWNTIRETAVQYEIASSGTGLPGDATSLLSPAVTNARSYLWGLDLSGTLQGAGGVGGLLAMTDSEIGTSYPTYDANGNISEYVSESGTILSHYDYSPFGELLIATSTHPSPFRFSTKYHDPETDTLYYGYRHYAPRLGRWLSRDPLGENGGHNIYSFLKNATPSVFDLLGLSECSMPKERTETPTNSNNGFSWDVGQFMDWLLGLNEDNQELPWDQFDPDLSARNLLMSFWRQQNFKYLMEVCENAPIGESETENNSKGVNDQTFVNDKFHWIHEWHASIGPHRSPEYGEKDTLGVHKYASNGICVCDITATLDLIAHDDGDFNKGGRFGPEDLLHDDWFIWIRDHSIFGKDNHMTGRTFENTTVHIELGK